MGSRGGVVQSLMNSLHKTVALVTPCNMTSIFCQNKIKLPTQSPKSEAHLCDVSVQSPHTAQQCLPPVWRQHLTECHHLWSVPGHTYDWGVLLHHLEYDCSHQHGHSQHGGHLGGRIYLAKIGMLCNFKKSIDYHNGDMKSPDYIHSDQLL